MKDNRKIVQVLVILTIVFTVMGGSLAYWNWSTDSSQSTMVTFKTSADFSCSADGGGNITHDDVLLAPTTCTDMQRTIKRDVTPYIEIKKTGINVKLNLWLKVNELDLGLANSNNFRYVLTTSGNSCTDGTILSSGNFKNLSKNDTVDILNNKVYSTTTTDKYYLYIWLDKEETNDDTMNQKFNFSLEGECTDIPQPASPVLDDGMIPVKIDENGDVFTVSKTDTSWYNYDNKEWANVVLVKDKNRSNYLNNLSNNIQVNEEDILAYYVWIPRYKYRIPSPGKCSSIDNHSLTTTPECYAPYKMSDSDKTNITAFIYAYVTQEDGGIAGYTEADAANSLEKGLLTGYYRFLDESYGVPEEPITITEAIALYNDLTGANVVLESEYNGNNILGNHTPRSIDIIFESKTSEKSLGDAVNTYYTHPAFTWGGEELSGIWVGKFETTPEKNTDCYNILNYNEINGTCDDGMQNPTILPNESPLRAQAISNQFATSQNLTKTNNIYGLSNGITDGHMMKNSEWGAVAYISHSIYGTNQEVAINNYLNWDNRSFLTGCGALDGVTSDSTVCTNAYGTDGLILYPQSTTGNITGIFDMAGGTGEYVMGNYNYLVGGSGFTEYPDRKYYDLYTTLVYNQDTSKGHAVYETRGWYDGRRGFAKEKFPWFVRGVTGMFDSSSEWGIGIAFNFSWRSVLVVANGT